MELKLKIEEINYGDIAVKMLPAMCSSGKLDSKAWQLTRDAAACLPEHLVRALAESISAKQKNAIIAAFAAEHESGVLKLLNGLMERHRVGVQLSGFRLQPDLTLTAQIARIDYPVLVERFLPKLKELLLSRGGMAAMMRPLIEGASAEQICGLLDRFLGARKEELLVTLVHQNQRTLLSLLENMARKQNVHLKISSLEVL